MSLRHAASISFSRLNGTFRMKEVDKNGTTAEGIAHSADPALLEAVYDMCSVRANSIGIVTKVLRENHAEDQSSASATRKRKNKEKEEAALKKARKKMADVDAASCVTLATSVNILRARLAACGGVIATSRIYLREQIKARLQLGGDYSITAVGHEYRSKTKPHKIRLTKPADCRKSEIEYLTDLAETLISSDATSGVVFSAPVQNVARTVPFISKDHTSAKGQLLRRTLEEKYTAAAAPKDDDLAVQLLSEYKGKLLFVNDDNAWPSQTFRVFDVQFYKGNGPHHDCWEATCEPVESDGQGGWRVSSSYLVPGENVVLNDKLYGIMVASLEDPDNPKRVPYVDEYIALHEARARGTGTATN